MPVTYAIDAARRLIRTTCSPPVRFADVIAHFRVLREDPACSGRLDVLLDVSSADVLPESRQLEAVSTELQAIRDRVQFGACAIVATRDALFGMMRIFEVVAGPFFRATRVFRTVDDAEAWLVAQNRQVDSLS